MNISDRTINPLTTRRAVYQQSEGATLPYTIDYTAMLNGDAITSSGWSCKGNGITITPQLQGQVASAAIGGTPGHYLVVNKITTAAGMVDERLIHLQINRNDTGLNRDYWPSNGVAV